MMPSHCTALRRASVSGQRAKLLCHPLYARIRTYLWWGWCRVAESSTATPHERRSDHRKRNRTTPRDVIGNLLTLYKPWLTVPPRDGPRDEREPAGIASETPDLSWTVRGSCKPTSQIEVMCWGVLIIGCWEGDCDPVASHESRTEHWAGLLGGKEWRIGAIEGGDRAVELGGRPERTVKGPP